MVTFKYLNMRGYSDVEPFEVVRVVSEKTVDVRRMNAVETEEWRAAKNFVPGGFCGTMVNQSEQTWTITSDPKGEVVRVRLGRRGWKSKLGYHIPSERPVKFYDYNF